MVTATAAAKLLQQKRWTLERSVGGPVIDPHLYAKIVALRFGGVGNLTEGAEKAVSTAVAAWEQDADQIGRVVRAHLFVEYFLTAYLEAKTPGLASIDDARLSFAQKLALLPSDDPVMISLLPGIKRLNAIRNRVAHSLRADLTDQDANVLRGVQLFAAMKVASGDGDALSRDPLQVLESFARFAGSMLQVSADSNAASWSPIFTPEELAAVRDVRPSDET